MLRFLKTHLQEELPFVAFKLPKEKKIQIYYQKDASLHRTKDFLTPGFVLAPFVEIDAYPFIPNDFQKSYDSIDTPIIKSNIILDNEQRTSFIKLVEKALSHLRSKSLKKVVLSRKLEVDISNKNPLQTFQNLVQLYPTAFVYYWYHPKIGLWMGATPERFAYLNKNQLETNALAGTTYFKENHQPIWGAKEKEEQQLVVDTIDECLQTSFPNIKLNIGSANSIQAGKLWHLSTRITGDSTVFTVSDVIKSLHPTPAVGGIPKRSSIAFIQENEGYDRKYYTGFLGPFSSNKNANLFVNLRCAELTSSKCHIYIGAGITSNSVPELEWEETQRKALTFCQAL